jgi:hypothetical protein
VSTVAGGTAVSGGRLPVLPIIGGAVLAIGLILYFVIGKSSDAKPKPAGVGSGSVEETDDDTTQEPAPQPEVDRDRETNRVDPNAVAHDLERALKNQRLWSTVEVGGNTVDVNTGSCRDANMIPMIDAARTALHNAGLTRLRCRENSGAVVFERDL